MAFERRQYSGNAAAATLAGPIDDTTNSIACVDLTNWPDGSIGPFWVTLERGKPTAERVKATGRSGNTLTGCARGQEGTNPSGHQVVVGSVEHTISKTDLDEANQHYSDSTLNHHTQYARTAFANAFTAANNFTNQDTGFGPGAAGSPGGFADVGSSALNLAYLVAGSSDTHADLVLAGKGTGGVRFRAGSAAGTDLLVVDPTAPTAGQTPIFIYYHNGAAPTFQRMTLGAADSGGAGFKALRVPN